MATLEGKWVWVWRWRRCDGGDPARVAERLLGAGCRGALVKAHDGAGWSDQGAAWREIARALRGHGVAVGGWGYFYGRDIKGEARRAIETVEYGEADLFVLDAESEFEGRPEAAEGICRAVRDAVGPDYPLYFSSFALARYHRSFPYETFRAHCSGAAPQVYWNAFRRPVAAALADTYADYAGVGLPPEAVFPVAGLYQEGQVPFPSGDSVPTFTREAGARGSGGVSFWSYEHMDETMWRAVAPIRIGAPEEELTMKQYEELSGRMGALESRVGLLEAHAQTGPDSVGAGQPGPPPGERYHVVGPEGARGLWGVAEHLGVPTAAIPGWIEQVKSLNGFSAANPIIHQGDRLHVP